MGFGSPFNRPRAGGHPAARPLLVAVVAGVLVAGLPPVASAAPTPGVSIGDTTVAEGNAGTTSATFTIQASPAPKNCCVLQVAWATAASTAAPPGDYTTSRGPSRSRGGRRPAP